MKLRLERFVAADVTDTEEVRKRLFLSLCIIAVAPVLAAFSAVDLAAGRLGEGAAGALITAILAANLLLFRVVGRGIILFRLNVVLISALLLFEIYIGGGDGYALLWVYALPLAFFFLLGTAEGLLWLAAFGAAAALVVFAPGLTGAFAQPETARPRFAVTFAVVSVFSWGLEASRRRFYLLLQEEREKLAAEKRQLQEALEQVRTLGGLLPICSSCKKIRDDQGYWNQIESYIRDHSDAEFTHGLCPECGEKISREVEALRKNRG